MAAVAGSRDQTHMGRKNRISPRLVKLRGSGGEVPGRKKKLGKKADGGKTIRILVNCARAGKTM